jgi:uncharacterized membrane protein
MFKTLGRSLRRRFLTGLLVVTPLAVTIFFIRFLFGFMDGLFGPVLAKYIGVKIPGLGIISTLVLIFLVGLLTANFVGRKIVEIGEALVSRLPIVKTIYSSSKQLIEALFLPASHAFKRVVLVEFARQGSFVIAFVTNSISLDLPGGEKKELLSLFIPSTPLPTTGWVFMVLADNVIDLPMSVEAGFRLVISGGIVTPPEMDRLSQELKDKGGLFLGSVGGLGGVKD